MEKRVLLSIDKRTAAKITSIVVFVISLIHSLLALVLLLASSSNAAYQELGIERSIFWIILARPLIALVVAYTGVYVACMIFNKCTKWFGGVEYLTSKTL